MCNDKTPGEQIRELSEKIKGIKREMVRNVLQLLGEQHEVALENIDQIESNIVVDLLLNGFPALLEVAFAALETIAAADDPSPLEFLNSIEQLTEVLDVLEFAVTDRASQKDDV